MSSNYFGHCATNIQFCFVARTSVFCFGQPPEDWTWQKKMHGLDMWLADIAISQRCCLVLSSAEVGSQETSLNKQLFKLSIFGSVQKTGGFRATHGQNQLNQLSQVTGYCWLVFACTRCHEVGLFLLFRDPCGLLRWDQFGALGEALQGEV